MKSTMILTFFSFLTFFNPLIINPLIGQSDEMTQIVINKGHLKNYEWQEFVMSCEAVEFRTGIPLNVLLIIAIHESGWFSSDLANKAFNVYGITALRDWTGRPVYHKGHPRRIGNTNRFENVGTPFRVYSNIGESVYDFAAFISHSNYSEAWDCGDDVVCWLEKLGEKYAENKSWASDMIQTLVRYEMLSPQVPHASF